MEPISRRHETSKNRVYYVPARKATSLCMSINTLPKVHPRRLRAVTTPKLGSVSVLHKRTPKCSRLTASQHQRGPPVESSVLPKITKQKSSMPWTRRHGARRFTQPAIRPARMQPADEVRLCFRFLDCNQSHRGRLHGTGKVHSGCLLEELDTKQSTICSPHRTFCENCYRRCN